MTQYLLLLQVVLERILWEFPTIKCLRVCLRSSQKESAQQRLAALWPLEIFQRLRDRHGGASAFESWAQERAVAVETDLEKESLGMNASAWTAAALDLDVVIHCAALVSWDERLDRSINANTLGTRRMLELTKSSTR